MSRKTRNRKYRRVYPYVCNCCGKRRFAFSFERAKGKLCKVCQPVVPHPDQGQLFAQQQ